MGMGKFRRRWIVNILRMQVVIVCAFFRHCQPLCAKKTAGS